MVEKKKRNQYAFDKKKYDHIHLQVEKGQREVIRAHVTVHGIDDSLNGFINRAISETMERDNEKDAQQRGVVINV